MRIIPNNSKVPPAGYDYYFSPMVFAIASASLALSKYLSAVKSKGALAQSNRDLQVLVNIYLLLFHCNVNMYWASLGTRGRKP